MHGRPCLPLSIDRSGLEALLLLSPETALSELAEDLEELGVDPELLAPISELQEFVPDIKYAPTINVMAHLLANEVDPWSEAVASFVRNALSCGYYLFNKMLFKVDAGLKSTDDTLVVPLANGSVELIHFDDITDVSFDAGLHRLAIIYDDDEGIEQNLIIQTGIDMRSYRVELQNDPDVGPVLCAMEGEFIDFRVIGHVYDLDEIMGPQDRFDWLLGLNRTAIDLATANSILTKCGFKRLHYLTLSSSEITKKKTKPRAPGQIILAEVWTKGTANLYVCEDPAVTSAIATANDFINMFGDQTKQSRYYATEDSIRYHLRPHDDDIALDGPVFLYHPGEDERNIAGSDSERLNAAEPLADQYGPEIAGVPALMRFAFDLLESDPEQFPDHKTSARAIMAFAHTVHNHQTLRLNQSMRCVADDFITYFVNRLTIAGTEFSLLNATFKADLSSNRLRLSHACGNRECDCVPEMLFIAP